VAPFFKISRNIPEDRGQMTEDRCPSRGRMTNDCQINYLIKELKKICYKYLNNYIFLELGKLRAMISRVEED
jgi:hypothetical protein